MIGGGVEAGELQDPGLRSSWRTSTCEATAPSNQSHTCRTPTAKISRTEGKEREGKRSGVRRERIGSGHGRRRETSGGLRGGPWMGWDGGLGPDAETVARRYGGVEEERGWTSGASQYLQLQRLRCFTDCTLGIPRGYQGLSQPYTYVQPLRSIKKGNKDGKRRTRAGRDAGGTSPPWGTSRYVRVPWVPCVRDRSPPV